MITIGGVEYQTPYADLLPPLTTEEYEELRTDIIQRGIIVPVVLDELGNVIDGQHRLKIAAELGLLDIPFEIRPGMVNSEKEALAWDLNAHRRHLSQAQKRDVLARILLRMPEQSNRQIARQAGVDDKTVGSVRAELVSGAEIPHLEMLRGKDGKSYPAVKPIRVDSPAEVNRANELFATLEKPPARPLSLGDLQREVRAQNSGAPVALQASETNEWYTPKVYLDAVHVVMGGVDVDPASNEFANEIVRASVFYDQSTDGLAHDWPGRVFLNPPYGRDNGESNQDTWSARLIAQFEAGITSEAILLVNAVTDRKWFQPLWNYTICFTDHRVKFYSPDGQPGQPTHGNVFVYFGENVDAFVNEFKKFGVVAKRLS